MKRNLSRASVALLVLMVIMSRTVSAWDKNEHRVLADSVFATVMRECGTQSSDGNYVLGGDETSVDIAPTAWSGATFGERVAFYASDDFDRSRFHKRGQSIQQQLRSVDLPTSGSDAHARHDNVVAAYLTEHLRALQLASEADPSDTQAANMLIYALEREAAAQGFLADAFSSGHLLSYHEGLLTFLARRNRIEAHDYHRNRGAYVINSRGEVWQTFGDGLLHWYPPTYEHAFEACATSLRELLVVWYVSSGRELPSGLRSWLGAVGPDRAAQDVIELWLGDNSGQEYYAEVRLPALLLIPMPVSATWSFRTDQFDDHGARVRQHFPQLREPGWHDPVTFEIDPRYLYPRESVPDWMVPEPLRNSSPTAASEFVRSNPDWASVRYVQARSAPPSYKGALLQVGGQVTIREGRGHTGGTFGLGYGLWDDLVFIKNVSLCATFMPSFHEPSHRLLAGSFELGFDLPGESWPRALRLESGAAVGLGEDFDDFGALFAVGLDSPVMPLSFTYAGITWRLKYQWFSLDSPVSGPALEMVLQ
ncbi:MAG: hypothetical protein AB1772_08905 [Candidatus Zixiibacteriota bacterium]